LLTGNGLGRFYDLAEAGGVRVAAAAPAARFGFLDEPAVRERLVDFADERISRVTFHVPAIHCVACVWLLENLFRLEPGVVASRVNFPRKEVAVTLATGRVKLSEVAALLAALGYEPELKLADLEGDRRRPVARRLWLQLGVAGFAFGNIMLLSLASYFGLDRFSGPGFRELAGWLSLLLAVPVVGYSARDYFESARASLRQRLLNIDVPIAAGIVALFGQSTYEVVSGRGEGYFDSLAGLLFFLLCGKVFQQKTWDRLAFDRDYKSFFPLSVTRKRPGGRNPQSAIRNPQAEVAEERVALSQLAVGDHLRVRHGELIPADARLVEGPALIDYSFVTGESEPVEKRPGDYLYAGGRQMGGAIEVEMVKPVSQSHLTSLWSQEAFRKDKGESFDRLTNTYSQRFTKVVIGIAAGAAVFWAFVNPALAVKAFASVLIVACPCALALAAPFALGTAQRVLARREIFLKSPHVLETLARVDAAAFDKTGTLTAAGAAAVAWHGTPLSEREERWLYSLTRHSTHPLAVRIGEAIAREHFPEPVRSFLETAGRGMEGTVAGHEIWMGTAAWLASRGARPGEAPSPEAGSTVHVAINGVHRGCFTLASAVRPAADALIARLAARGEVALLSGDHARERERFAALFGPGAHLRFNQSPLDKLGFIRRLQAAGRTVMMVGDGLNDAGALQQSDVGVAVVENLSAFSPASDVILKAAMVPRLAEVLQFAAQSVRVVRASFLISAAYNVVGIAIAAQGLLSPVVCAILMPLSSVTVVGFACGLTAWLGRRLNGGEWNARSRGDSAPQPSTFNPQPAGGAA
jgi:Cu+-exporting ATPase